MLIRPNKLLLYGWSRNFGVRELTHDYVSLVSLKIPIHWVHLYTELTSTLSEHKN